MVPRKIALTAALALLGGAGCVEPLSVDGRQCPCRTPDYVCCAFGNICLARGEVCQGPASARFLPLRERARWLYWVTDYDPTTGGKVTTRNKEQIVQPIEDVPPPPGTTWDKRAFRLRTERRGAGFFSLEESWQELAGTRVVRHYERKYRIVDPDDPLVLAPAVDKEDWWEPGRLRIDEDPAQLQAGKGYSDMFTQTTIESASAGAGRKVKIETDQWEVIGVNVPYTVEAGTFLCVVLKRYPDRLYWYARGVGKIMELTGDPERPSQTEELAEFTK